MTRGLAKNERVANAQQAAENCITFGEARHGAPGAFNFSEDHDSLKTSSPGKKAGEREVNSVSGRTLADDIYSVAGNTTVPVDREGGENEDGEDSFNSSIETDESNDEMEMDSPEEQNTGKKMEHEHGAESVVDLSGMETETTFTSTSNKQGRT